MINNGIVTNFVFTKRDWPVLPVFRFLYCLALFIYFANQKYRIGIILDRSYVPLPLLEFFFPSPPSEVVVTLIYFSLLLFLLLSAIGLLTRLSLILATLGFFVFDGLYYGTVRTEASAYVWHSENIIFFTLLILSISPKINHLSLFRPKTFFKSFYGNLYEVWPENLIGFTLGAVYFGSAYCKIMESGLSWVNGDNVRAILAKKYFLQNNELALAAASLPLIALISISVLILIFELFFIFGIYISKWRWLFIVGGLCLHLGIFLLLSINFLKQFCLVYLLFLTQAIALTANSRQIKPSPQP